jgi:hypothetical protein
LAKSSRMLTLVQRNLILNRHAVRDETPVPLFKTLTALNGSAERSAHQYAASPVLRTNSIDDQTKSRGATTASAALMGAVKNAVRDALESQPGDDLTSVTEIVTERGAATRKRLNVRAAWWAGAIITSTLAIFVRMHLPRLLSQDSGASASAVQPSTWAVPDTLKEPADSNANTTDETGQTYRLPIYWAGERDGDKGVIAEQQKIAEQLEAQYMDALSEFHQQESEANDLEQQVHEQSTQIDSERLLVDNSDPSSLENFHSKMDYYDSLVERASTARVAYNALGNPLNILSQRVSAQNAYVNRMIHAYNAKSGRVDR